VRHQSELLWKQLDLSRAETCVSRRAARQVRAQISALVPWTSCGHPSRPALQELFWCVIQTPRTYDAHTNVLPQSPLMQPNGPLAFLLDKHGPLNTVAKRGELPTCR
jgi:hypothetical protein